MEGETELIMTPWVCRLERRGLFGRKHVMLMVIGRIFVQIGGPRDQGWITRTVGDTLDEAVQAYQDLRSRYLGRRYVEVPWAPDLMPELPMELLDPDRGAGDDHADDAPLNR